MLFERPAVGDKAVVLQNGQEADMDVVVTDSIAEGSVLLSQAIETTLELGAPFGSVQVKKAS